MSISKARGKSGRGRRNKALAGEIQGASFRLPTTASWPALLEKGSDDRFRRLVYDLLTIASRMTTVREHLGARMGISAPQYSLLMAVGQFQGACGVGVTAVAKVLHVSSAFVATEVRQARASRPARQARQSEGWPCGVVEPDALGTEFDCAQQRRDSCRQRYLLRHADAVDVCRGVRGDGRPSTRLGAGDGISPSPRTQVLARSCGIAMSAL